MAAQSRRNATSTRDKERASRMRSEGVCRTTGRCGVCYRIVSIDSWKSRYNHNCMR